MRKLSPVSAVEVKKGRAACPLEDVEKPGLCPRVSMSLWKLNSRGIIIGT